MLPLKLSITGLYSYQKKQTIDFEALTDAGLFGIFGAVGSGKSSVLEAIGFVLYGETERLNSRDKRSYNMLNLKSDRANIEFEFLNFEERKFKFVADWKRNKKRFEETTPIERLAYEWKAEQWTPMNSADATSIIGLSYENFRRTIIIPQGKFKEFLELKGKDRSDMMKEIFYLQRFDLASKVGIAQSDNRTELDQLKGLLSGFETISVETISVLENEVIAANAEMQNNKIGFEFVQIELQKLTALKVNFEDLEKKKNRLLILIENKPKMDALQTEINAFEITEKAFKVVLNELFSLKDTLDKIKKQFTLLETRKKEVVFSKAANQTIIDQLQPQFDQLENSKNKVTDFESIEKILDLELELVLIDKKSKEAEILFLENEKKEGELKQESVLVQQELVHLKSKKLDGNILMDVGNWFTVKEINQVQFTAKVTRIKTIQDYLETQKMLFLDLELSPELWKTVLDSKKEILLLKNKSTFVIKTQLLVAKELAHFAGNLHAGENCPLCGALEHPNVMQAEDVSEQLAIVELNILELEDQEKEIFLLEKKALKIENDIAHAIEQMRLTFIDKETLEAEAETHLAKFIWKGFDATNNAVFLAKKEEQQDIEKLLLETEKKETENRVQQDKLANQLKIQLTNKGIIASEKASKVATTTNELSKLKTISFTQYEKVTIIAIRKEKMKLHQENSWIALEYKTKTEAIILQNIELAGLEASIKMVNEQVVSNEKFAQETQLKIDELLKTHQFDSVNIVQEILSKKWDITFEKNKTTQFAIDLKVAELAVTESEKLVLNETFDNVVFEETKILVVDCKLKYETQLGKVSTLQNNLRQINAAFKEKTELLARFEVLDNRNTNLVTLSNMFSASGFVNYVSSIYLQNLSDVANVRFHRMTKNQLSLTINNSNEFEVIDYLNDGASRSVKTLSGGQGFQASLCLALALAESVQSLNKNDKNFFFIDEGFGTQDPESIAIVFETLHSLHKENRIVGIISHVAELQERIPRSINVVKDEEKGSVVNESWC